MRLLIRGVELLLRLLFASLLLMAAGCSSLLPRSDAQAPSPFNSYSQAWSAAERIVPFRTDLAGLAELGFDTKSAKNVTLIPYPNIVARLAPYSGVPIDQLERGIQACIRAQSRCTGYLFRFQQEDSRREGNFAADFFNVRRVTHTTGWSFEAFVVVSDGIVLFRNAGGEPQVERFERRTNPLGPLQPAGEAAGAMIVK
jgi:hypothetical protein